MPVQRSSPDGLVPEVPFAHVAVSTGTRHVVVAGQIASDASGALVAHGEKSVGTRIFFIGVDFNGWISCLPPEIFHTKLRKVSGN